MQKAIGAPTVSRTTADRFRREAGLPVHTPQDTKAARLAVDPDTLQGWVQDLEKELVDTYDFDLTNPLMDASRLQNGDETSLSSILHSTPRKVVGVAGTRQTKRLSP